MVRGHEVLTPRPALVAPLRGSIGGRMKKRALGAVLASVVIGTIALAGRSIARSSIETRIASFADRARADALPSSRASDRGDEQIEERLRALAAELDLDVLRVSVERLDLESPTSDDDRTSLGMLARALKRPGVSLRERETDPKDVPRATPLRLNRMNRAPTRVDAFVVLRGERWLWSNARQVHVTTTL